jgi:hypothetical protein
MNRCHASGCAGKSDEDRIFIGDKRAIICADCAYAMPDPLPEPPFEVRLRAQVTDLLRRARQLEIELEKWEKGKCASLT